MALIKKHDPNFSQRLKPFCIFRFQYIDNLIICHYLNTLFIYFFKIINLPIPKPNVLNLMRIKFCYTFIPYLLLHNQSPRCHKQHFLCFYMRKLFAHIIRHPMRLACSTTRSHNIEFRFISFG